MKNEFEVFCDRAAKAGAVAAEGLGDGSESLALAYRSAVQFVTGIIAALMLEPRDIPQAEETCIELRRVAGDTGSWESAVHSLTALGKSTGVELLTSAGRIHLSAKCGRAVLRSLLASDDGVPLAPVYFNSIPSTWISRLYERLLDLKPALSDQSPGVELRQDSKGRKKSGSFFTPPYIIDHIITNSLGRINEPSASRILDPSMGPGDFLIRALGYLSRKCSVIEAVENCIFGCDIDPIAVDIARFLLWLESGGHADAKVIAKHLVCADALCAESLKWSEVFSGFDAVIGNPPYIASKNGMSVDNRAARGQSDYYLMFLESVIENRLVRPGGTLAMVLPDPFLVRGNAAHVRRELLGKWTVESVVHIKGAFPSVNVANVILDCTNKPSASGHFPVVRLDKSRLRRQFELRPGTAVARLSKPVSPAFALVQPRAEVLYLVDDDRWRRVFSMIHGPEMSLSKIMQPFAFLKDLGVEATFRGEEIGKKVILASDGGLPILLGGQSLEPYRITWEGRRISRKSVTKPIKWYEGEKILLQKSSARLIAAFDGSGHIIPQSIYGIKLKPGNYHPLYLLALLNSAFLNEYIFRAFTGYKLVQPQIELEDVRRLPIRLIRFDMCLADRTKLADEGQDVFDSELLNSAGDFPLLGELVREWMDRGNEAAVHDLLVHLAGLIIKAESGEPLVRRIRSAIDAVVDNLYGVFRIANYASD